MKTVMLDRFKRCAKATCWPTSCPYRSCGAPVCLKCHKVIGCVISWSEVALGPRRCGPLSFISIIWLPVSERWVSLASGLELKAPIWVWKLEVEMWLWNNRGHPWHGSLRGEGLKNAHGSRHKWLRLCFCFVWIFLDCSEFDIQAEMQCTARKCLGWFGDLMKRPPTCDNWEIF